MKTKKIKANFNRFVLILLLITCYTSYAQVPKKMNYQGIARDEHGALLTNKNISLKLHLISGADINSLVYSEVLNTQTNSYGLFSVKLGEGQVLDGDLGDIAWGNTEHFIAVEIDVESNGHFIPMGVSQLLSVPYAFYAEKAGKADELSNQDVSRDIPFSGTFGQTIRHNGTDWEATSSIYNSGTNIGINTITPSEQLDVAGNINIAAINELKIGGFRAVYAPGTQNLALGYQSGNSITSGQRNMFLGWQAGKATSNGSNNAIIGYRAGTNNTSGSNNNIIGNLAGYNNTAGQNNIFYGYRSGYNNTSGISNFFAGTNAGHENTIGNNNIALGTNSGFNNMESDDNIFIGRDAGYNTTGEANTFIGKQAGLSNTSGYSNTYIGNGAGGMDTLHNATAIGANTFVAKDNSLILGDSANVGIGTSSPLSKLHIHGDSTLNSGILVKGSGILISRLNSFLNTVPRDGIRVGGINAQAGNLSVTTDDHDFAFRGHIQYPKGNNREGAQPFWGSFEKTPGSPWNQNFAIDDYTRIRLDFTQFGVNKGGMAIDAIVESLPAEDNAFGLRFLALNGASIPTEKMRLNKTGNLGIGTTSPQSTLHVSGFTKLGDNAPAIQTKHITGNVSGQFGTSIDLGVLASEIIGISVLVDVGNNQLIPPCAGGTKTSYSLDNLGGGVYELDESTETWGLGSQYNYIYTISGQNLIIHTELVGAESELNGKEVDIFLVYVSN